MNHPAHLAELCVQRAHSSPVGMHRRTNVRKASLARTYYAAKVPFALYSAIRFGYFDSTKQVVLSGAAMFALCYPIRSTRRIISDSGRASTITDDEPSYDAAENKVLESGDSQPSVIQNSLTQKHPVILKSDIKLGVHPIRQKHVILEQWK